MELEKDRSKNKVERDEAMQQLRDKCLGNEKEIQFLREAITERNKDIKELRDVVSSLNANMSGLSEKIKVFTDTIDKLIDRK
jgi:peptidoglycan hydrolase CwlO-like protein